MLRASYDVKCVDCNIRFINQLRYMLAHDYIKVM